MIGAPLDLTPAQQAAQEFWDAWSRREWARQIDDFQMRDALRRMEASKQ